MGNKTLTRLLIALAVIGGIAAILHFTGGGGGISKKTPSTSKKKVFANFPINDVSSVTIKEKNGTVTLSKGEQSWEVKERDGYKADTAPIATLLKNIWDLNIGQPVTIGRSQYGRLQLVNPGEAKSDDEAATVLTFSDADGSELASLWLGKVFERSDGSPSPMGGPSMSDAGRYVKPGNTNSVYLVSETFSDVKTDPSEWLDKAFFKVDKLKRIELSSGEKSEDWVLERKDTTEKLDFADSSGEKVDPSKVTSITNAFSNVQMEDVLTGDAKKEAPTDNSTFVITTFENFTYEINVGEKNDLNELPITFTVDATFEEKRKPGEEESDEEAEKLDKEFAEELQRKKDKLAQEKALEGYVFKIRSYVVDPILKKRSEILEVKEGEDNEEAAPGVTLPGLPGGATPPAAAPQSSSKAKPKSPGNPAATGKAKAQTKAKPKAKSQPKPKAKESPKSDSE